MTTPTEVDKNYIPLDGAEMMPSHIAQVIAKERDDSQAHANAAIQHIKGCSDLIHDVVVNMERSAANRNDNYSKMDQIILKLLKDKRAEIHAFLYP